MKTLNNPHYNPTLGITQPITTATNFVGADSKDGVTVYKPVDVDVFKMCEFLTTVENTKSIKFNSDDYVQLLNGIENKYEITKKCMSDIKSYLNTKKLYPIPFNYNGNIATFFADGGNKSRKFTKTYIKKITNINEFEIVKVNPNNQYFTFKVITIVSHLKVEWFVENKLFFTKVKMRMFSSQQFKKIS